MSWKGKLVGFLLGLLLGKGRPMLAILGLGLGHLWDIGFFTGSIKPRPERPPPEAAPSSEDPYQLLGVPPRASDDEVEQAYRRRMSEYHPDRVANAAKEIRELADRRARAINQAYDRIKRERGIP